jgi:ribosomal protein S18 acetylase RimI-like enzyme
VLKELYVRREYQRRGIGNMLVQWGVRKADELGLLAYTEATPAGLRLYLRHGFVEVDRMAVDLEAWGRGRGQISDYHLLLREARGRGKDDVGKSAN